MVFKKKKRAEGGAREWEQTLTAGHEPSEGDPDFEFRFGKGDAPAAEPVLDEDEFLDDFTDEPDDSLVAEALPADDAVAPDAAFEDDDSWDDEAPEPTPPEQAPIAARRIQHTGDTSLPAVAPAKVETLAWVPRRKTPLASIHRSVDNLNRRTRRRPAALSAWIDGSALRSGRPAVAHDGMELIPTNVLGKRILYETEGGFVIEVTHREGGRTQTRYYTVPIDDGRDQALSSIKSGRYAKVTTVTDEVIDRATRRAAKLRTAAPVVAGRIVTWPITQGVNVTEVEGIGTEFQARLKELGYYTTDQLRLGNAALLANHIGAGVSAVERWQSQAELMLVKGVGKQQAELLAYGGVRSIDELRELTPKQVSAAAAAAEKGRKVKHSRRGIGPTAASSIVAAAKSMRKRSQPFPELGPSR